MRPPGGGRDHHGPRQAKQPPPAEGGGAKQREGGGATQLPLLPLFDHVLLPGGFLRVTIPGTWPKSRALVNLLLQQQTGDVMVAAVPYLTGSAAAGARGGSASSQPLLPPPPSEDADVGADGDPQLDLDRLHHTGTAARVLQLARRTASGGWSVTLEGRCRLRVRGVHLASRPPLPGEVYEASVEQLDYFPVSSLGSFRGAGSSSGGGGGTKEQEELSQELLKGTRRLFLLIQGETEGREAAARVARALSLQGPARLSDVLGSLVARTLRDRLALLAALDVTARLQMVVDLLNQMLEVAEKAASSSSGGARGGRRGGRGVGGGATRALRLPSLAGAEEAEEEDDEEDGKQELAAIMQKLRDASPPPEVLRAGQREFKRLQRGSEQHPGYAMSLAYLETLADLPWSRFSVHQNALRHQQLAQRGQHAQQQEGADGETFQQQAEAQQGQGQQQGPLGALPLPLAVVRQRLDEAHYGLEKIKERIVQYVAVQRLRGWDARAPILCFIGPPGVGKTSLARSIADVLGRPFQRISLGGVRDEAEVRGHRRTYIGAMPGRLIQAVRKAGVRDPLLLLDEVDKMGRDARGDPAAALLEVLDPEQNAAFVDTYLGLPFDLSSSLFVATANRASDIPAPLLDRLEVVQLGGYTLEEKVHIAERHLIPRLLAEHGLHQGQLVFPPEAVRAVIEGYTGEAGVRNLSRCLAAVCRHVAVRVVQQREQAEEQEGGAGSAGGAGSRGAGAPRLGGGGKRPAEPLPPLPGEEAAGPGASASASQWAAGPMSGLSSSSSSGGGGGRGSLQLQQDVSLTGPGRVRLWERLLPLGAVDRSGGLSVGAAAAVSSAVGGYPWAQLHEPACPSSGGKGGSGSAALADAGLSAGECSCPPRKQPAGWFSWLRWARHDSSAEHGPDHSAAAAATAGMAGMEAAASCACAGGCGDHDCCCHASTARAHFGPSSGHHPAASEWGEPGELGTAADSISWEASWRSMAPAGGAHPPGEAAPLLCGPGSMQILRPPHSAQTAAGPGLPLTAGAAAVAAAAAARALAAPSRRQLQRGPGEEDEEEGDADGPLPPLVGPSSGLPGAGMEGGPLDGPPQIQQLRQIVVDAALIEEVLGPRRYEGHNSAERVASPGTAAGLVWTSVGGKVQYIECICVGSGRAARSGQLTLTGQLGDVLEESARIALSWVRAHAAALGLPGDASCPSRKWDVHIHLPAGAVPKDGPSAGVTLAAALVSLFTGKCVRSDAAMTGELTLRGLVLPVGGIKEKLLAAQAAGMARVLVPARNLPDVQADVPVAVRQGLEVIACQRLEDVLAGAFDPPICLDAQAAPVSRL